VHPGALGGGGVAVYVAGSTPHTFANNELHQVLFLLICSPGGFEKYFRPKANTERITERCRVGSGMFVGSGKGVPEGWGMCAAPENASLRAR
jgi:hypothetical protein